MYTFQRESNIHPSKTGNSERKIVKYSSRKTKVESSLSYLLLSFQVMLLRILNFYGCPEEAIERVTIYILGPFIMFHLVFVTKVFVALKNLM